MPATPAPTTPAGAAGIIPGGLPIPRRSPMPRIAVHGADIHYEERGAGPEAVVFAHGLLWSGRLFDRQVEALAPRYRCIPFGVIERQGVLEQLDRIAAPTLILVGDKDLATPPVHAQRLHARIAGSRLQVIPDAGHTSTIEEPTAVNAAIADFLAGLGGE
jgi:pimeloyl-ACP methyl ester carboxylesterase